jgi:peptide chain release factor subunit 1
VSAANEVTDAELRTLAETSAQEETVLSLYVDLDPQSFAAARGRASEIDSLLDRAHREIEAGERSHAALLALRASLERARELLTPDGDWAKDARSYALFLCEPLGLEHGLRLAHPVAYDVVISDTPFIAPLTGAGPSGRVCVLLVDERFARVLRGSSTQLHEVISFGDAVHGRHSKGGWSQARYQRSIAADVEAHLRHVARVLSDLLRIAPFQRLLIACTQPLWPRVIAALSSDVAALLDERRVVLDVGDAGIEDVVAAVQEPLAAEQREREDEALARLREHVARDGDARAAVGLPDVLDALVQRRVETLLHDDAFHAEGVLCERCGWMGVAGERCPVDDNELKRRGDIVDDALRAASGQSAELLALHDRPDLGPLGRIAATLRF